MPDPADAAPTAAASSSTPPPDPDRAVKTSSDWLSLFLGTDRGSGLESPSLYTGIVRQKGGRADGARIN